MHTVMFIRIYTCMMRFWSKSRHTPELPTPPFPGYRSSNIPLPSTPCWSVELSLTEPENGPLIVQSDIDLSANIIIMTTSATSAIFLSFIMLLLLKAVFKNKLLLLFHEKKNTSHTIYHKSLKTKLFLIIYIHVHVIILRPFPPKFL